MKAIQAGTHRGLRPRRRSRRNEEPRLRRQPAGRGAQVAGRLPDSVDDRGEGSGRPGRGRPAAAGQPWLHQRHGGAGGPARRASAGRHDAADRSDRQGVRAVRAGALRGGDSALRADPGRRRRTISTRRCASPSRTRCSATSRRRSTRSGGRSRLAPDSPDVRTYLGLHYARTNRIDQAAPLLEQVVAASPQRLLRSKALAAVRERQGKTAEAIALYQQVSALRPMTAPELVHLGELAMSAQQTPAAIAAFEKARGDRGRAVSPRPRARRALPRRPASSTRRATALDRVPPSHPDYADGPVQARPGERAAQRARPRRADRGRQACAQTRPPAQLIANERLFSR